MTSGTGSRQQAAVLAAPAASVKMMGPFFGLRAHDPVTDLSGPWNPNVHGQHRMEGSWEATERPEVRCSVWFLPF